MSNTATLHVAALGDDDLRSACPAIFADRPHSGCSDQYTFVPTHRIISQMRDNGWQPVQARAMRSTKADRKGFQKHLVRFRHPDLVRDGDEATVESVLVNSHDRTSTLRFLIGAYVYVCANGLVIARDAMANIKLVHMHFSSEKFIESAMQLIQAAPTVYDRMARMRDRALTEDERLDFAQRVLDWRYRPLSPPITPAALLEPRRDADRGNSLWKTFNVVQENTMRGGVRGLTVIPNPRGADVRRWVTTQPISNIDRDLATNDALWQIAESYLARN